MPPPSRRLVLTTGLVAGGALVSSGVSGCTINNPLTTTDERAAETAPRSLSPDIAVAVAAVVATRRIIADLQTALKRHPGLGGTIRPLVALHQAHQKALDDAVPRGTKADAVPTPYAVPPRPQVALEQLLQRERALAAQLTGLALRAQSGSFARLLGSMIAGQAQTLVSIPGGRR